MFEFKIIVVFVQIRNDYIVHVQIQNYCDSGLDSKLLWFSFKFKIIDNHVQIQNHYICYSNSKLLQFRFKIIIFTAPNSKLL